MLNINKFIYILFGLILVVLIVGVYFVYFNNPIQSIIEPQIQTVDPGKFNLTLRNNICEKYSAYYVSDFSEQKAVTTINGEDYYIDEQGNKLNTFGFLKAQPFSSGKGIVTTEKGFQFMNSNLELSLDRFDMARPFVNENGMVQDGNKWYIINQNYERVSEDYDFIYGFDKHGFALAKKDTATFLITKDGIKSDLNDKYFFHSTFVNDYAIVSPKDESIGKRILEDGTKLDLRYFLSLNDELSKIGHTQLQLLNSNGIALASDIVFGSYFVDSKGEPIIDKTYYQAYNFDKDFTFVADHPQDNKDNKLQYYLIDKTGQEVMPEYRFEEVKPMLEDWTFVKLNGKWHILDASTKSLSQDTYSEVSEFNREGVANVSDEKENFFVDIFGRKFCFQGLLK